MRPVGAFCRRFPEELLCRICVTLRDSRLIVAKQQDSEGFLSRSMQWETVVQQFECLACAHADAPLGREIVGAVNNLEAIRPSDLTTLLGQARATTG